MFNNVHILDYLLIYMYFLLPSLCSYTVQNGIPNIDKHCDIHQVAVILCLLSKRWSLYNYIRQQVKHYYVTN